MTDEGNAIASQRFRPNPAQMLCTALHTVMYRTAHCGLRACAFALSRHAAYPTSLWAHRHVMGWIEVPIINKRRMGRDNDKGGSR